MKRRKTMYNRHKLFGGLLVFLLVLVQTGCGKATLSPGKTYKVGEAIPIEDNIILTLQSWDISMDRLITSFSVENKGSEKFLMRGTFSILHQQKGSMDLAPLAFVKQPGLDDCVSTLYGYVLPGETMSGTVCWRDISVNGLSYPLQVKYSLHTIDILKKSVAVWTLDTHKIGETVSINNQVTIALDNVSVSNNGDALQADFTVDNLGPDKLYFDGAFSILRQHGMPGNFAPGMAGVDACGSPIMGYILPGQKVSGNFCWSGLTRGNLSFPVQIKFEFSSQGGEVIWVVNQ
jgi:hypothetical protein